MLGVVLYAILTVCLLRTGCRICPGGKSVFTSLRKMAPILLSTFSEKVKPSNFSWVPAPGVISVVLLKYKFVCVS